MIYFSDDCDVLGLRYENWKIVFLEQRCQGTLQIWFEPFTELPGRRRSSTCAPTRSNALTSPPNTYWDWVLERFHRPVRQRARDAIPGHLQGVPRRARKPASFTITAAVEKLKKHSESRGG